MIFPLIWLNCFFCSLSRNFAERLDKLSLSILTAQALHYFSRLIDAKEPVLERAVRLRGPIRIFICFQAIIFCNRQNDGNTPVFFLDGNGLSLRRIEKKTKIIFSCFCRETSHRILQCL